jgi:hypothetical protein
MLILPISNPNKCRFLRIYINFNRIKYPVGNKCINDMILFEI